MSSPPKAYIVLTGTLNTPYPSPNLATRMQAKGYQVVSIQTSTDADLPSPAHIRDEGYTFFGVDSMYWAISPAMLARAYSLYNMGINIVTTGNDTTYHPDNPIWTGAQTVGAESSLLTPVVSNNNHPVAQGWTSFPDTDARIYLTGVRSSAVIAGSFTFNGQLYPAIIAEQNPNGNGARYVHVEPYMAPDTMWNSVFGWAANPGGMGRVWDGSSWVYRSASVYDGSKWVKRPIKSYSSGSWSNI